MESRPWSFLSATLLPHTWVSAFCTASLKATLREASVLHWASKVSLGRSQAAGQQREDEELVQRGKGRDCFSPGRIPDTRTLRSHLVGVGVSLVTTAPSESCHRIRAPGSRVTQPTPSTLLFSRLQKAQGEAGLSPLTSYATLLSTSGSSEKLFFQVLQLWPFGAS